MAECQERMNKKNIATATATKTHPYTGWSAVLRQVYDTYPWMQNTKCVRPAYVSQAALLNSFLGSFLYIPPFLVRSSFILFYTYRIFLHSAVSAAFLFYWIHPEIIFLSIRHACAHCARVHCLLSSLQYYFVAFVSSVLQVD